MVPSRRNLSVGYPGCNLRKGGEVIVTARRVVTRHATGRLQSDVDASSTQKDRPSLAA